MKKLLIFLLILITPITKIHAQADNEPKIISIGKIGLKEIDPYKQPMIYKKWWKETVTCAGVSDVPDSYLDMITWIYVAADGFTANESDGPFGALSYPPLNVIWISAPYILHDKTVKHEMLHYILWHNGRLSSKHPLEFNKCNLMPS